MNSSEDGELLRFLFIGGRRQDQMTAIETVYGRRPQHVTVNSAAARQEFTPGPADGSISIATLDFGRQVTATVITMALSAGVKVSVGDFELRSAGVVGAILLIDPRFSDPIAELEYYIKEYSELARRNAIAIGIAGPISQSGPIVNGCKEKLEKIGLCLPVYSVDITHSEDVKLLIGSLIATAEVRS